jgi:hypothetical protein
MSQMPDGNEDSGAPGCAIFVGGILGVLIWLAIYWGIVESIKN